MLSLCKDVKIAQILTLPIQKRRRCIDNAQNLPAQKAPETKRARLQKGNENRKRQKSPQEKTRQGKREALLLIVKTIDENHRLPANAHAFINAVIIYIAARSGTDPGFLTVHKVYITGLILASGFLVCAALQKVEYQTPHPPRRCRGMNYLKVVRK